MKTLLLEIGTEELPISIFPDILAQMEKVMAESLMTFSLTYKAIKAMATPRRLTVFVKGLPERQAEKQKQIIGPPYKIAFNAEGKPTKATIGFTQRQGVSFSALRCIETPKGQYVGVKIKQRGEPIEVVLTKLLPDYILSLPFPKSMRWAEGEICFARPIHWILALLDEKLIQFGLDGIKSSNVTYGHRFITQGAITVCHPNDYLSSLEKVYVIVDHKKRQQGIVKVVNRAAQAMGGKPLIERDLLNWVNFLVEYPIAISGKINPDFLELPAPILITAMKHHQKCFAVQNVDGNLLASFVAVIDNPMAKVESVQRGLEMVLEARLADAMFFYKGDLKIKLSLRFSKLKDIIFQADLGSLLEKVKRLERLTGWLAEGIVPQKKDIVMRAALLSKTDLTTQMVKEFPELEGVVGGIYAQKQGEAQAISNAISEQYLPIEAGGALPQTIEGTLLALADKIDTLVGYFALDIVPTGTTDPFALRRKAIGILRILNEKNLKFSLFDFIDLAFKAYGERFINQREEATKKIIDFFKNRLASLLSEKGYPPSVIEAVLAVFNGKVKETFSKADALFSFSKTPAFIPLVIAYKRVHRIIETPILNSVDPNLFKAPQQKALYEKYLQIKKNIDNLVKQGNYLEVLELLKTLKPFIDDFFDHVMVMVDDKKRSKNSLALLTKIKELFLEVADLSKFPI